MLSQRSLEVFRAVMQTGSLVGAAQEIRISQPAVSRHIQDLEARTGLVLFQRSGNRAIPTRQAFGLLSEVERAFIGLREIEAQLPRIASGEAEKTQIAAMPVTATTIVPEVVAELTRSFPEMNVELQAARSSNILPKVRGGAYALGLVSLRQPTAGIRVIWRGAFPYFVLLPEGDPLAGREFILPQDLAGRQMIGYAESAVSGSALDRVLSGLSPAPQIRLRVHLSKSTWALVNGGCGVAIVDVFAAENHRQRGGIVRPFVTGVRFELSLVTPEQAPRSAYVEAFVAALQSRSLAYQNER